MEDLAAQYGEQLLDLKMNSKPVINVLTMLAEDNIKQAHIVVQTIERHLNQAHPTVKLPVLYLIDSIVKNVKRGYETLFTQNIVSTFCGVFEKVDDKVKQQMFKLRNTWNEVFPQRKLYAIDVRCHQQDKNWPISAPPPNNPSIHVNPRFLSATGRPGSATAPAPVPNQPRKALQSTSNVPVSIADFSTSAVDIPVSDVSDVQMRAKLLQKQKELLELQAKKIELELMQTNAHIEAKQLESKLEITKQEQILLHQAEMAKSKTVKANQLLSNYPKPASSVTTTVPQPNPPATTSIIHDPRLRQMETKSLKDAAAASSKPRTSPNSTATQFQHKVKMELDLEPQPIIKSVKTAHDGLPKSSNSVVSKKPAIQPLLTPSMIEDLQARKKNLNQNKVQNLSQDITEFNMFEAQSHTHSKKYKDHSSSKSDKSDKSSNSTKNSRRNRDRSRSSERSGRSSTSSGSKEKREKKDKKLDKAESEEDYEDETKGFSLLNIKPKRPSVENETASTSTYTKRTSLSPGVELKLEAHSPTDKQSPRRDKRRTDSPSFPKSRDRSSHLPKDQSKEDSSTSNSPSRSPKKTRLDSDRSSDKEKKVKDLKDKRSPSKSAQRGGGRSAGSSYNKRSSITPKANEKAKNTKNSNDDWKTYDQRKQVVLKRNYRKTGVEVEEEENKAPLGQESESGGGDVDLRFHSNSKDVDLRKTDGEPPNKKTRGGNSDNIIDDLFGFGREDVDLRQGSSWSQVKRPSRGEDFAQDDEDIREILHQQDRNRPPQPVSPASSVASQRSTCDPLGRPLLYNKLPDDPEERKRSLDSRSHSIDPLDRFRREYVDRVINQKGEISTMDMRNIFTKAEEHVKKGLLTPEQCQALMKQIQQINDLSAMREVQQMQELNWQEQGPNVPNPWTVSQPTGHVPWMVQPRGPTDMGPMRFPSTGPTPQNGWVQNQAQRLTMDAQWNASLPRPRGPNPFEEALMPRIDDLIPRANEQELRAAERDTPSSIPIDRQRRQLRFYGDAAVILMGRMGDEPQQISFQRDGPPITVLINGKPMELMIGEKKRFELNRKQHTLKIGTPTRELYIDDRHYEVCFGGPAVRIPVDGRLHAFELIGPPPRVELGKEPRYDLIAGRVNLIVDAVEQLTVFLDEKPQKLDMFTEPVILRFIEGFHKVLVNGRPFPVNFGPRLPFTVTIPNAGQHYLRFSALTPETEKAIGIFTRARQVGVPMPLMDDPNLMELGFRGRGRGGIRGRGRAGRGREIPEHNMPHVEDRNPLDMLTNLFPSARVNDASEERRYRREFEARHSYESEVNPDQSGEKQAEGGASGLPDIANLLAMATRLGFLTSSESSANTEGSTKTEKSKDSKGESDQKTPDSKKDKPSVPPLPTVDVSLVSDQKNNLKERRDILIDQLWTGLQCSSCGLRFPPDQTVRYAQHLDLHFRRNRREKANAKKAQSRKWYYDLSDWIQFLEVEDLEERAESMFERQEEAEGEAGSPSNAVPVEKFSILSAGHEGAICPQCGEEFKSYYDNDQDEWRLEDALLDEVDEEVKVYHSICHQDYLKSLVEESTMEMEMETECITDLEDADAVAEPQPQDQEDSAQEPSAVEPAAIVTSSPEEDEEDEVLILKEGKKEVVLMEIDVDDEEVSEQKKNEIENEKNIQNKESEIGPVSSESGIENANPASLTVTSSATSTQLTLSSLSPKHVSVFVHSPIVINSEEDSNSNLLPGINISSQDSIVFGLETGNIESAVGGGVFDIALSSGERPESPEPEEVKRIVYKSMEFDFPVIKLEPVDHDDVHVSEVAELVPEVPEPEVTVGVGSEPVEDSASEVKEKSTDIENIDLTLDDESVDECDGAAHHFAQMTAIDGNLQQQESSPMPFVPPAKIKINITSLDINIKPKSPQAQKEEAQPSPESGSVSPSTCDKPSESVSDKSGDSSNAEIVFTEELKRLKPSLVGRKLVNCPPRQVGREESGLCVIS